MTTPAAAALYQAQHVYAHEGLKSKVYNPHNKPIDELPIIYGFNNGGSSGWMSAVAIAEDGKTLSGHCCSSEAYMPADLGMLERTSPEKQKVYRAHYPDGYRTEFVGYDQVRSHRALIEVIAKAAINNADDIASS